MTQPGAPKINYIYFPDYTLQYGDNIIYHKVP